MPESSDVWWVVVRAPNGEAREFQLRETQAVLGRDESCDIRVEDRKVSRRHVGFLLVDGRPMIDDLGSINGVRVNQQRVKARRVPFREHDVVEVGAYVVRLRKGPASPPINISVPPDPAFTLGSTTAGLDAAAELDPKRPLDGRAGSRTRPGSLAARPAAPPPRLIGLEGPGKGIEVDLEPGENVVGRADNCRLKLTDTSVSRHHARLLLEAGRVELHDLASANGVFLNGDRVDQARVGAGDLIRFGRVEFRLEMLTEAAVPSYRAGRRFWLALVLVVAASGLGTFAWQRGGIERARAFLSRAAAPLAALGRSDAGPEDLSPFEAEQDETEPELAAAGPMPGDAGVALPPAPGPDAGLGAPLRITTSTTPFGPRDEKGWPRELPIVDPDFDLDGFAAERMAEADDALNRNAYAEVRKSLGELLLRDPLHPEGRALLEKVSQIEVSRKRIEQAIKLENRGNLLGAYRIYATLSPDMPEAQQIKERLEKLKPRVLETELKRAERERADPKRWVALHKRLQLLAAAIPEDEKARDTLLSLEREMRARSMTFKPYLPGAGKGDARPAGSDVKQAIAARHTDRELARAVEFYVEGAFKPALEQAERHAKRLGSRGDALLSNLRAIKQSYDRIRTEIANDPRQAWALLLELQRREQEFLPPGVRSTPERELASGIAQAFGDRGAQAFEQSRFEEAFRYWDAGSKLNADNPHVTAGLQKLERHAEKMRDEAEIAAQRGGKEVCERFREITRITQSSSEVHRQARARVQQLCPS